MLPPCFLWHSTHRSFYSFSMSPHGFHLSPPLFFYGVMDTPLSIIGLLGPIIGIYAFLLLMTSIPGIFFLPGESKVSSPPRNISLSSWGLMFFPSPLDQFHVPRTMETFCSISQISSVDCFFSPVLSLVIKLSIGGKFFLRWWILWVSMVIGCPGLVPFLLSAIFFFFCSYVYWSSPPT